MKRQIIILVSLCVVLFSLGASAQTRGGGRPCSECAPLDSYWCQMYPAACEACWETCTPDSRRVRPLTPRIQPGVNYLLDRTIGVRAVDYEAWYFDGGWTDNYGVTQEIRADGFNTIGLWMKQPPYNPGHWDGTAWIEDEYQGAREDMAWFWQHVNAHQVFVRFHAWQITDGGGCRILENAPLFHIIRRLYEYAWWRDLVVVFVPWEQDWYLTGCHPCEGQESCCPDGGECSWEEKRRQYLDRLEWLVAFESERQRTVELVREEMRRKYPTANLRILHAMTVNRFKGHNEVEWAADLPTLAERIGQMVESPDEHEPDLVGISYWLEGVDPVPVLDWLASVTHYPKYRFFVDEIGAREHRQVQRFEDYIPAFWDWGIRTVMVWVYRQNWVYPPDENYGLYREDGAPTDGLVRLQSLLRGE